MTQPTPPTPPTSPPPEGAPTAPGSWRSWHLHVDSLRPEALETLLLEALLPAVDLLAPAPDGTPTPWFFLRYWQGGPHLRLRIAGLDGAAADRTTAELERRTAAVNAALPPGDRLTPQAYRQAVGPLAALGEGGRALPPEELRPPGVHPAGYQPEELRYGGADLMALSEQLFFASSVVTARACRSRPGHGRSLLDGLEAMAATLAAWPGDQAVLLRAVRDGWSGLAATAGGADTVSAQADRLRPAAGALRALADGAPSRWTAWTARLRPAARLWSQRHGLPGAGRILGSHLHMTQNRLGVGAGREGLLAALLLDLLGLPDPPGPSPFSPSGPAGGRP